MDIEKYLKALDKEFRAGHATEHTHRPALKTLLEDALPKATATNEPKHIACGAPDFVLTRKNIPFGYVEAKDIGKNLDDKAYREQFKRYRDSLDNLIITDYLEFRWYRKGELVMTVNIAEAQGKRIKALPDGVEDFSNLLKEFNTYTGQTITSAADLAKRMAAKARMLADVITKALQNDESDEASAADSDLSTQLNSFRKHLIRDIKPASFADMYAQTVAYGMFAARLRDQTPDTFTRQEAAELIPANNPFLRSFFQHIAGYDLDKRIHWIVDDLADIFCAAPVGELMADYGKETARTDPFLHFYETFLGEYDPKLRKARGVYYTPEPVVNFIVRAVDEILRSDFNLPHGLADESKTPFESGGGGGGSRPNSRPRNRHGHLSRRHRSAHLQAALHQPAGHLA